MTSQNYDNLDQDFPEVDLFERFGKTLVRCSAILTDDPDPANDEDSCSNLIAIEDIRTSLDAARKTLARCGWKPESLSHTEFGVGIPDDPIIYAQCPIHKDHAEHWATTTI
jgi:hypothetical protein